MRRRTLKASAPVDRVLLYESRRIPYRLHRGKRRGLRIAVTPDLVVNVFAPSRAPDDWVEMAISQRASWIVRTLDKVAACEILTFPERFVDGATLRLLGCEYRIAVAQGPARNTEILMDTLVVTAMDTGNEASVHRTVERWYRSAATDLFRRSLEKCMLVDPLNGVIQPTLAVRNMRSRWGSCSSTGRVTLNLKLAMLPEILVDYVVMHELCHLEYHDHSKRYYAHLTRCMPDWKERKRVLDRYRIR